MSKNDVISMTHKYTQILQLYINFARQNVASYALHFQQKLVEMPEYVYRIKDIISNVFLLLQIIYNCCFEL